MESADSGFAKLSDSSTPQLGKNELDSLLSPFDLKRLESYASNLLDYHVIVDLLPMIAGLHFSGKVSDLKLSGVQSAILLALGLQKKVVDDIEKELNLPHNQILAMLVKVVRKVANQFREIQSKAIEETLPPIPSNGVAQIRDGGDIDDRSISESEEVNAFKPLAQTLDEDLEEGADEATRAMREKQKELINSLELHKYAVDTGDRSWDDAEAQIKKGGTVTVGVKTKEKRRNTGETAGEILEKEERAAKKLKKSGKKGSSK